MAKDTRVKGYVSSIGNQVVPLAGIDDSAGARIGASTRNIGAALGGLGAAIERYQAVEAQGQMADLEADFSNWNFETEQQLTQLDANQPANQSNRFKVADELIAERQNQFMERVRKVNPLLEQEYIGRIAQAGNQFRGSAVVMDMKRKTDYFVERTGDVLSGHSKKLEGQPQYLPEAKEQFERFILSIPNEHLPLQQKTDILYKGNQKLMSIAYQKEYEQSLEQGASYVDTAGDELVNKVAMAESGGGKFLSNSTTTAAGLHGITNGTFMRFMKTAYPELVNQFGEESLKYRNDPKFSAEASKWYLKTVGQALAGQGLPVNDGTLYMGYFLGEAGGPRMLRAPEADLALNHASPEAVAANKSVFYRGDRPVTVGEMKQWAAKKMGQTSIEDDVTGRPEFATFDYDSMLQAKAQAEANVRQRAADEASRKTAEKAEVLNSILMETYQGNGSREMIQAAIDSGRFDYDDIKKMDSALKDAEDRTSVMQSTAARLESGSPLNPDDKDHKKGLNTLTNQMLGGNYTMLDKQDPNAFVILNDLITRTGGKGASSGVMVPADAINHLRGFMKSGDWGKYQYAAKTLSRLAQVHPQAMGEVLSEREVEDLMRVESALEYRTDDETKLLLGVGLPSEVKRQRDASRVAAEEYVGKDFDKDWGNIKEDMFDGWFTSEPVNLRQETGAMNALKREYKELFLDNMTIVPDAEAAHELAQKMITRKWGVSTVDGSRRVMKHPPNLTYPQLTDEEMDADVRAAYSIPENWKYELTYVQHVGKTPVYGVTVYDDGDPPVIQSVSTDAMEFQSLAADKLKRQGEENVLEYKGEKGALDNVYGKTLEGRGAAPLANPYSWTTPGPGYNDQLLDSLKVR